MSKWISFFVGSLLFFSVAANSQQIMSFQECSSILTQSKQYVEAKASLLQQQAAHHEISNERYQNHINEIEDFRQYLSMDRCLSGENTAIYDCLHQNKGDFTSCRQ